MVSEINVNPDDIKNDSACDAQIEPAQSQAVMDYLMGHFVIVRDITAKKLAHTRTAIADSIQAVEGAQEKGTLDPESGIIEKLQNIDNAIATLCEADGFLLEELEKINDILDGLSHIIKSRSDDLVKTDKALTNMIDKITSEEYKATYQQAKTVMEKIQTGENLLSGLPEADYGKEITYKPDVVDAEDCDKEKDDKEKGYVILPSGKKARAL